MFKIGEFSKLTQVSVRMLRYYDENGLLPPARVDPWTGYRLYTAAQIPILNRIIFLRDSGFHIAEIADALKNWDETHVTELLENKRREIEGVIDSERRKLNKIEQAVRDISRKQIAIHCNVTLKSVPGCQVLSLRRRLPDYFAENTLWEELSAFAGKGRLAAAGKPFAVYHDEDYREQNVDVEVCMPISKTLSVTGEFRFRQIEDVPEMACMMVCGPFENISGAYQGFVRWLEENSRYKMAGPDRQIVHRGPWNSDSPEDYLIELQIPVKTV